MATLLRLKAEVEHKVFTETKLNYKLKMTFSGATEAHVLTRELRHANVGVLVYPRPYPRSWESRRMYVSRSHAIYDFPLDSTAFYRIPGPPLTPQDFVSYLVSQGIEVGIMPQGFGERDMDAWAVQNLRFDTGWVGGFYPCCFRTGFADHVLRSIKTPTEGSPRFKPLRSHLRTLTHCLGSMSRMMKKLTQERWLRPGVAICWTSKGRSWRFYRRSWVSFTCLSEGRLSDPIPLDVLSYFFFLTRLIQR